MIPFAVEQIWHAGRPVKVAQRGNCARAAGRGCRPAHYRRRRLARQLSLLPLLDPDPAHR